MNVSNTQYKEIYGLFVGTITDHPFLKLPEEDIEALCLTYLKRAISKFYNCRQDLSNRDDELQVFNFILAGLEKEILASLMVTEWLTPQVYNITVIKQFLGDSEYKHFSQANHLDKLIKLKDKTVEDTDQLAVLYTLDIMGSIND